MKKNLIVAAIFLTLFGCSSEKVPANEKSNPEKKISIKQIKDQDKEFSIVELDPKVFEFRIIENEKLEENRKSISQVHRENNSAFTFNGSFFSKNFEPLGLLVSQEKTLNPIIKSKLQNSIFWLDKNNNPHIDLVENFNKNSTEINFAIQNGPLLINNGKVTIDDKNHDTASRTAIGITENNKIIIIFLRFSLFKPENLQSLHEFATTINNHPEVKSYHLKALLNLDGGSSTGFAIGEDYYPELELVQNIIVSKPRR